MNITNEQKQQLLKVTLTNGTNAWDYVQAWPKESDRPWIVAGILSCIEKGYKLNEMMIGWETRNLRTAERI